MNLTNHINQTNHMNHMNQTGQTGHVTSLQVWTGSFAQLAVDLLVNPTNLGKTGCYNAAHCCIDSQVHRAAGPLLRRACRTASQTSQQYRDWLVTPGFDLPAKHVLHVVEPRLFVNKLGQLVQTDQLKRLQKCYLTAMRVCDQMNLRSLAFSCMAVLPDLPDDHANYANFANYANHANYANYANHTDHDKQTGDMHAVRMACQTACQTVARYVKSGQSSISKIVFCVPLCQCQLYLLQFQQIVHMV